MAGPHPVPVQGNLTGCCGISVIKTRGVAPHTVFQLLLCVLEGKTLPVFSRGLPTTLKRDAAPAAPRPRPAILVVGVSGCFFRKAFGWNTPGFRSTTYSSHGTRRLDTEYGRLPMECSRLQREYACTRGRPEKTEGGERVFLWNTPLLVGTGGSPANKGDIGFAGEYSIV